MRRVCLAALLVVACGERAEVTLELDVPEDPALDPFALDIGSLTLSAWTEGELLTSATRPFADRAAPPGFGTVPVADAIRFELMAASPGGRVLGFGRSPRPLDVRGDQTTVVPMSMRRPFVYIGGADAVVAVDATREPGQDYTSLVDVGAPTTAVAEVPGGRELAVVAGAAVVFLASATHERDVLPAVTLSSPAHHLAVSPDGRWLVATHDGVDGGLSIIDVEAARAGRASPRFVAVESPGSVAIAHDKVWVVSRPVDNFFCQGDSDLVVVSADEGGVLGRTALPTAASVLAVDRASEVAFVIVCGGRVLRVDSPGAPASVHAEVPGPTALDIAQGRVWMMGHSDQDDAAQLILSSAPIDGGPALELPLAVLEERAVALSLEGDGQGGLVRMNADLSSAFDIDVLPDGEHVAILVVAGYTAQPAGDAGGGQPILPEIRMITYEYQLLQLDTGLGAQRLRLSCEISWTTGALLDDFACGQAPGQDIAALSFVPTELAALYGSD